MSDLVGKPLGFSESFLTVEYVNSVEAVSVDQRAILVNAGDAALNIAGSPLQQWKSSIYSSVVIPGPVKLISIRVDTDFVPFGPFPYASQIMQRWTHVYDIFHLSHLRETKLWRSDKERIGGIELNLWYAAKGTNCGIHNEHDFRELHTQIFGTGRMQKFREDALKTLYQDVFMCPGFTHEPFYDAARTYPWHQYYADTDCVWLAVEFHDR